MIEAALKHLEALAVSAAEPQELASDPRHLRWALGGTVHEVALPEPPREHTTGSLEDLIRLAKRFDDDDDITPAVINPVVWYSENEVVLVIDDAGHRLERVTLSLLQSDVWRSLVHLRDMKPWLDPKAFIRLLRVDLVRTLEPGMLLDKVRKVKFENGSATTTDLQRNRESLSRDTLSKVEAGGEIPEEVTLEASVYKTLGEREPWPVRCAVEVDPARGAFQLVPVPDELERVQQMAMGSIRDRLSEFLPEGVPHYYGRP